MGGRAKKPALISILLAGAVTLAACSGTVQSSASTGPDGVPAVQPPASAEVPVTAEVPARSLESTSTDVAATATAMERTLKDLVSANPKPDRQAVRTALAAAGVPNDAIEVSASRTPTGLDVDAMEAAALSGEECVVGQIRDGAVTVTVLPVLSTGKCFIGDSR